MFNSVKVLDGFSTCFRQWRAEDSHCRYLHGYALSFVLTFEGELDQRNWVFDFGGFKNSVNGIEFGLNPKEWFDFMFDHTVIIAEDDPEILTFKELHKSKIIHLRIIEKVGCEMFAKYVYEMVSVFIKKETLERVRLKKVEVRENNKNSASYEFAL